MTGRYSPEIHNRRSIRLKGYDYSAAGAYYITVCTRNRECLFGEVKDGIGYLFLTDGGIMFVLTKNKKEIIDALKSGQLVFSIALGEIVEILMSGLHNLKPD